jgi:putative oxygen-independent coproporphyrinogen III oxidase
MTAVALVSHLAPDTPALADEAAGWKSAYVHIPFCARVCPYCDFAVVVGEDGAAERYVAALLSELMCEPGWGPLDAVAFGGGTPSRVAPRLLGSVVDALRTHSGLTARCEVSIEVNPEDVTVELACGLAGIGVTRVSVGAQSFQPDVLGALGRCHRPADIERAVQTLRSAGIPQVNIDLIYGTPGETLAMWVSTVEQALALHPDHVSTYALTVERGTALGRAVAGGGPAPDPDLQADGWEAACRTLRRSGLVRYEVSNHARPGAVARYNLSVWAGGEYLGLGMGAHRHRDGVRSWNVRRLDTYIRRVEEGISPRQGEERLTPEERERERVLLGLRLAAGVEPGEPGRRLLESPWGCRLVDAGVVSLIGARLVVTRPLLTDEVQRALLAT